MQAATAHRGNRTKKGIDIPALQASWQAFDTVAHLRPIHSEADYDRMVAMMNALLDVAGDDEDHPLSGLVELLADVVSRYEQEHHAIEAASPNDTLRFLMEARGLKQDDLSAIVPQSNLSAILAGKRKISATMAGKLGGFFGISPAVFVPK
ncbi:MAG TPA: helix-turn-helix domain-containing protein [Polaromonas sp.]|uniref:helix-turn-helix domain-containing protein n=1 Tax=Polaromonas sp. TaxID=1869339 RepID=UPI002D6E664B|nr:helix-turn-helix domain-containing protein [Polaromonas sp.]HYW56227.1 helix-turn-helix domain-containing protein [Polaromonas sp.]